MPRHQAVDELSFEVDSALLFELGEQLVARKSITDQAPAGSHALDRVGN